MADDRYDTTGTPGAPPLAGRCVDLTPPVRYTTPPPVPRPGPPDLSESSSAPSPDGAADPLSIGVPAEALDGERRVAMTPAVVPRWPSPAPGGGRVGRRRGGRLPRRRLRGQGRRDRHRATTHGPPRSWPACGCSAATRTAPTWRGCRSGQVIVGMAAPLAQPAVAAAVAEKGATLYALELLPRTTRAQSMDVLSSQANIAGYRAVLMAAGAPAEGVPAPHDGRRHPAAGARVHRRRGRRRPVGDRHRPPPRRRRRGLRRARGGQGGGQEPRRPLRRVRPRHRPGGLRLGRLRHAR